jgi:hypothetical protein
MSFRALRNVVGSFRRAMVHRMWIIRQRAAFSSKMGGWDSPKSRIYTPLPHAELAFLSACQTATGELSVCERRLFV